MSDDLFITRLMNETFKGHEESEGHSSSDPHASFNIKRSLSHLPVVALEGQILPSSMLQFNVRGVHLELPPEHSPLRGVNLKGGFLSKKSSGHEFLQAMGQILEMKVTNAYVDCDVMGVPWLIFWDELLDHVDQDRLLAIFGRNLNQKSA